VSNYFTVILHNTVQGEQYDVLTKFDLTDASWATALTVTGAVGNATTAQIPTNGSPTLFVWARIARPYSFYVALSPISQEFFEGDTVTLTVDTGGNTNLTFQWYFNGVPLSGATNSSYTIYGAQSSDAGDYTVLVSDGTNSFLTAPAHLTDDGGTGGSGFIMFLTGPRQDYTFRSGVTYVISPYYFGSNVTLYGKTVLEAGAVLKFDTYSTNASLVVLGDLECKGQPYNPSILTSIDDDFSGNTLAGYGVSTGWPQPPEVGAGPYLELAYATNVSIQNLRVCFADQGITTPLATSRLDIWNCQFLQCNYGVVNLVQGGVDSLHNVLFAGCGAGIGASTNSIAIEGEQVTANVGDLFVGYTPANRISLTNSIIFGESSFANLSTSHVVFNPGATNFQTEGFANYYLAANSPLHNSGTASISPRLQTELRTKSTFAPVEFPAFFEITGPMTLSPQVPRYSGGPPDYGYYYDSLDYAVANLILADASVNILPGTAIAVENQYLPDLGNFGLWTTIGFDVLQGSSVYSHGTPNKPTIFTAEKQVQESPDPYFSNFQQSLLGGEFDALWFDAISFVPDYQDDGTGASPPIFDFQFCQFYMPPNDYHVWSGADDEFQLYYTGEAWEASFDSSVYLTLKDCALYGGRINLGNPDIYALPDTQIYPAGSVSLFDNTFNDTSVNLDPTFYEYGVDTSGLNVDLSFQANNNLFRRSPVIHLEPIPASAGNWTFENNLFDKCGFLQSVEGSAGSIDYGYNADYLLSVGELGDLNYRFAFNSTNRLVTTTTGDGFTDGTGEITLSQVPPYEAGPFGNYYLPTSTPLHQAGSRTADLAGLCQYTTRLDQTKEVAGQTVDIGAHYVTATNGSIGWFPSDYDHDGIPDYVEDSSGTGATGDAAVALGETDWKNPRTDGVSYDPSNAVYLNIDLAGVGIVGRLATNLSLNPIIPYNPLTLTQVITGQEPTNVTFRIPIPYELVDTASSNRAATLTVLLDGSPVSVACQPDDSGLCLVTWDTMFNSPGFHTLQARFDLSIILNDAPAPDPTVITAIGPLIAFTSQNALQFDPFYSQYSGSDGAILYATTPTCQDATYTIELQTTNGDHIKTISGTTTTGEISEPWDLTDDNGNAVTNDSLNAIFNVTLLDPGSYAYTLNLNRVQDLYEPADGNFTIAYTCDHSADQSDLHDCLQLTVVDQLIGTCNVTFCYDHPYGSTFNTWSDLGTSVGNPGHLATQTDSDALLGNLENTNIFSPLTKNFYFFGHGSQNNLGTMAGDDTVHFYAREVAYGLGNQLFAYGGPHLDPGKRRAGQAYRLVFLDGCCTAMDPEWAHAFGIYDRITTKQLANWPDQVQAFVGWTGEKKTPGNGNKFDMANCYSVFWSAWQSGLPLDRCIWYASQDHPPAPLNFEDLSAYNLGPHYQFWSVSAMKQNGMTYALGSPRIRIYGYAGMTRTGYQPGYDNSVFYR
jgi:hypothetical protein